MCDESETMRQQVTCASCSSPRCRVLVVGTHGQPVRCGPTHPERPEQSRFPSAQLQLSRRGVELEIDLAAVQRHAQHQSHGDEHAEKRAAAIAYKWKRDCPAF